MNESKQSIDEIKVEPASLVELIKLVDNQTINNNTAKDVLNEMFATGQSAQAIVEAKGLAQISDESALVDLVNQILDDNADNVARYLAGEEKLRGFFVGQVMRETKGQANPGLVNKILSQQLASRKS